MVAFFFTSPCKAAMKKIKKGVEIMAEVEYNGGMW